MLSAHRYVAYTSDIGESFRPIAHPWLVKGAYGVSWVYLAGDVAHEGYKAYVRNQRVLYPELHLARSSGESGEGEGGTKRDPGLLSSLKQTVGGTASAENTSDPHYENTGRALTGGHIVAGRVPALEDYRAVMAQRAVFQAVASMGLPAFTIHSIVRYSGRALKDARNRTVRTWGPIGLGLAAVPFLPFVFDEPVEHATEWLFYNAFRTFGGEEAVQGRAVMGAKEVSQMKKEL
ncbi:hypothetical protein BDW02DRAFT_573236 [Decorospora gaudefroyi]|uniref:Mitochondrial fission process protein 1 n=1 Tax=Decorospora gaudefroyi TaxID=184978 RepID=A0A6A5KA86_9PLEO|nr:hypothetical protein BDW02DRAFT_573236 [Decorospora gaudefroyi]